MAFAVFSITHISENIDLKKLIHIQKDLYQVQDYFEKMSIMTSLMFISDWPFKEVTYSFISLSQLQQNKGEFRILFVYKKGNIISMIFLQDIFSRIFWLVTTTWT